MGGVSPDDMNQTAQEAGPGAVFGRVTRSFDIEEFASNFDYSLEFSATCELQGWRLGYRD